VYTFLFFIFILFYTCSNKQSLDIVDIVGQLNKWTEQVQLSNSSYVRYSPLSDLAFRKSDKFNYKLSKFAQLLLLGLYFSMTSHLLDYFIFVYFRQLRELLNEDPEQYKELLEVGFLYLLRIVML